MEGFSPPFYVPNVGFFSNEKVICSHPVWGLWREFGEDDRLATGVRGADKRKERQGRRRRVGDGLKVANRYGGVLWLGTDLHSSG